MNQKEGGETEDTIDVASEVALCHDFLYDPSEQSTSIRVRMLVSQGRAKDAERLLDMNTVGDCLLSFKKKIKSTNSWY